MSHIVAITIRHTEPTTYPLFIHCLSDLYDLFYRDHLSESCEWPRKTDRMKLKIADIGTWTTTGINRDGIFERNQVIVNVFVFFREENL